MTVVLSATALTEHPLSCGRDGYAQASGTLHSDGSIVVVVRDVPEPVNLTGDLHRRAIEGAELVRQMKRADLLIVHSTSCRRCTTDLVAALVGELSLTRPMIW